MSAERSETPSTPSAPADPAGEPASFPEAAPVPDDADDTRGAHLRRLLRLPVTMIGTAVLAVIGLIVGAAVAGIGVGVVVAAAVVLGAFVVVWLIANRAAQQDFFNAYAQGRGLTRVDGHSSLPPLTPLLRKGDRRYADQRFNGVLPGGLDGSLCLYTYEEETRDSDGDKQTTYVHFTLAITELPATTALTSELFCQRRAGFRFMDSMEDVFRKRQRVEQESEAVDRSYEIFIGEHDDLNRARQVLSPSFLVWLERNSDENFAFELSSGSLVCNVKGHKKSAAELDALCVAGAAVAHRLREEAAELPPETTTRSSS
ncbi:MAG: hypothetical protein GEU88_15330 [Solirubrobacterales bacterium]|nr:hypothetical protein [Solirubrobacterales bacterium]